MSIATPPQARRLPIVGIMGSGTSAHADRAEPLGRWLAQRGVHLLTGVGGGVMASVSRAFCETPSRVGSAIGVIPAGPQPGTAKPDYFINAADPSAPAASRAKPAPTPPNRTSIRGPC